MNITFIAFVMFIISFILIFIGITIIMISSISRKLGAKGYSESEKDVESGAVIIIGPFPFAIGSRRIIKPLLLLSLIFFIAIVILFFVLLYIPKLVILR